MPVTMLTPARTLSQVTTPTRTHANGKHIMQLTQLFTNGRNVDELDMDDLHNGNHGDLVTSPVMSPVSPYITDEESPNRGYVRDMIARFSAERELPSDNGSAVHGGNSRSKTPEPSSQPRGQARLGNGDVTETYRNNVMHSGEAHKANGSEPSLSSRSNGHPPLSSPVTSPPAATSPFGILSPTSPTPVDTAVHYNHNNMHLQESKPQTTTTVAPPTEATNVFNLVQDNGDLDGQAPLTPNGHPPSYLKLSCALSGYSSYKSYGSPTSVNTSVNSSNGSLDNQQSVNNTRTGVSPKRHMLGKHNGTVSPCRESNEELSRTEDSVDSSVVTHKHAERKSQSLSARNTPAQKVVTDRARKSADYRQASRQIENTDDIPSREEAIIQNGPIQAFCEDDDVVLGRNDNCDIGSVENVEVVSGSDTITHTNIEDNSDQDVTIRAIPKLQLENDSTTTELDTPTKDGAHFMDVVAGVTETFRRLCDQVEQDLKGTMPDDVSGKLRVTVGQAHLLINKKFQQFIGLCEKNINEDPSVPFYTTCEDLAGFWDMVEIQVTDVMNSFHKIETLRKNNWVNNSPSPSVSAANLTKPISPRSKTAKTSATQIAAQPTKGTPKSSRATEAQKARQEARKRLLAMKRAGRQRKISQSEESENIVEIYVPE